MKINKLLPLALLCSGAAIAGQGDQMADGRYSIATHGVHALNGINAASNNAHLTQSFNAASVTSIGVSAEIGDVDFYDDISDLIDELDRNDLGIDEINQLKARFDSLLVTAGKDGYVDANANAQLPLSFAWKREKDTISLSSSISGHAYTTILDAPIEAGKQNQTITTKASAYVKAAEFRELSLGYSRLVWQNRLGDLHAGARVNVQRIGLSKQVVAFEAADGNEEIEDILLDDYKDQKVTSTELALDLSAYWSGINYNAGLTISNVNEPEFEFNQLGNNCNAKANEQLIENCRAALHFSNRIALQETYTATRYATFQANYINDDKTFSIDASVESEHNTPVGLKEQWFSASIAGFPESIYIPNARLTYSNNLAGNKLDYLSGELSWGWFGLAGGYALSDTIVDDESVPRGGFLNLTISNKF